MGIRDPIVWTYLPTDTALALIRLLATPRSAVIYYCGADFPLLAVDPRSCRESEIQLLRSADVILATCSKLAERCRVWNDNVTVVPAVVNLDAFPLEKNEVGQTEKNIVPVDSRRTNMRPLSDLARPIIGYVGGLHKLIDYRLLTDMARVRPEWSWVLVGPAAVDVRELVKLSNIHLLGRRPHSEIADYIREFDVCVVPYLDTELTATVVPLKVNEYLAMGKPVVSSALPTVCEFDNHHQTLFTAPNQCDRFLESIEHALSEPKDEKTVNSRRAVAALGDTKVFLNAVSKSIEAHLRNKESML